MNSSVSVKESKIEFIVKIIPKSSRLRLFTNEFYQTLEEIKIPILHRLFEKI